ncbi:MAG: hypothetical protein ACLFVJ_01165 [Persicimonas sp.]
MHRALLMGLTVFLTLSGCAQPEKFTVDNPFPSQDEFRQLSAESVSPEQVEPPEGEVVQTWELVGPFPQHLGHRPHEATGADEIAYYEALPSDGRLVTSEAMHCAAREVGHFLLEHDKLPYESLNSFIKARCGITTTSSAVRYGTTNGAADDQSFEAMSADMAEHAGEVLDATEMPVDAGFWLGRKGDKVAYVSLAGKRAVAMRDTPIVPDEGGEVVLEGEVLDPEVDSISGAINRGDFGVEMCQTDPRVELPQFRVVCEALASDEFAYFQLQTGTANNILYDRVLQQLVWPGAAPSNVYRSPATRRALAAAAAERAAAERAALADATDDDAEKAEADADESADAMDADESADAMEADAMEADAGPTDEPVDLTPQPLATADEDVAGQTYPEHFISLLNKVRQQAGMGPLQHARRQSASIQTISEQLEVAWNERNIEASNKLVMGILAGWDVDGSVVDGEMSSDWVLSEDPAQLLEAMLESPGGRYTLMDPDAGSLALGVLSREGATKGVVASYQFIDDDHPNRRAGRVLDALNEQRDAYGSNAARETPKLRSLTRKLSDKIEAGELDVLEARDKLLDAAVRIHNKQVYSYTMITHSLDDLEIHRDLLTSKALPISVVVAPYQHEGYPWTMYALIFVYPQQPKANIARLDR